MSQLVLGHFFILSALCLLEGVSLAGKEEIAIETAQSKTSILDTLEINNLITDKNVSKETSEMISLVEHYKTHPPDLAKRLSWYSSIQKKEMALSYLDYFYKNIRADDPDLELNFNNYLRTVDQMFPNLEIFKYFHNDTRTIIDLNGLQVLVSHFQNKDMYAGNMKDTISINFSDFSSQLNHMIDSDYNGYRNFLIKHSGRRHITPVFVKRSPTKTIIIITDSGPSNSHHKWLFMLQEAINRTQLKNVKIFGFTPGRQSDSVSCPVMSLRDILEESKVNLFKYVDQIEKDYPSYLRLISNDDDSKHNLFIIDHYPANFMKVTQSLKTIQEYEYCDLPLKYKDLKTRDNSDSKTPLKQIIESHTETIGDGATSRKINFYTRKKAFKYSKIIVQHLLENLQ